jgi:rubrerythrin
MGSDKLEEMFLFAIQAELNEREAYLELGERGENPFFKNKMKFLAQEEIRHRTTLEDMYKVYYPEKEVVIPPNIEAPRLTVNYTDEGELIKILETAMEFEKEAEKYYLSMADKLSDDLETSTTLTYFAAMEANHYELLRTEKEQMERLKNK